ncbi:MAG: BLUF domain-containing protein [Paracoccaceae bacterium]
MKFIVYVSQAAKPFEKDQLARLLEHSRARNAADEVTGLLIYRYNAEFDRGNFVQALEGPQAAIEDVWRRISNDPRHHTIVVIEEGDSEDRMFGDWSMGFKNVEADDLKDFEGFADLGGDAFWAAVNAGKAPEALDLLVSFYERD